LLVVLPDHVVAAVVTTTMTAAVGAMMTDAGSPRMTVVTDVEIGTTIGMTGVVETAMMIDAVIATMTATMTATSASVAAAATTIVGVIGATTATMTGTMTATAAAGAVQTANTAAERCKDEEFIAALRAHFCR